MKLRLFTLAFLLATPWVSRADISIDAGISYFDFRQGRIESNSTVLAVDDPGKVAPFVAATFGFSKRFGLRASYHYITDVKSVVKYGSMPGSGPITTPVIVYGHYEDDIHLFSFSPEFKWSPSPTLTLAAGPQLNWVASRGRVAYSSTDPTVLLMAPHRKNDDGFTLGGPARAIWSVSAKTALSLGYQYLDLDPSFNRRSHVLSASFQLSF